MLKGIDREFSHQPVNPFVFVVGCPRSGTTMLRRILNAHQLLAVPKAETHWIPKFYVNGLGLGKDRRPGQPFIEALEAYERFAKLGVTRGDLEAIVKAHPGASYAEFVSRVFDRYGQIHGKRLVGDKTPGYARFIDVLHDLFPQARFIHLVRDGRDVALSMLSWDRLDKTAGRVGSFSEDPLTTVALFWDWMVRLGREAGARLPDGQYHEVKYENLVRETEQASGELCEFLCLPYDPAMPRYHEGRQRRGAGLSAKKAWLPPTTGLRDWRSQMSEDDSLRFEAAAGELLVQLGYERRHVTIPRSATAHAHELRARFSRKPHPDAWQG